MATTNPTGTMDYGTDTAATDPISEAGSQAGQTAGHLAERATDLGMRQADRGKEQAAQGITQVADSIRKVSMDMEGTQPQIADVAQTAADQAERFANYLKETDAREMLRTVEDTARRQPILFLGGAFLLGFAASRLFKAAGSSSSSNQWQGAYGNDYTAGATDYRTGVGAGTTGSTDAYRATGPGGRNDLDELPSEGI